MIIYVKDNIKVERKLKRNVMSCHRRFGAVGYDW